MNHQYPLNYALVRRSIRPCHPVGAGPRTRTRTNPAIRPGYGVFAVAIVSLLWSCHFSQNPDVERVQSDNIRLTKTLHAHLNHRDWQAVAGLCAETVRYRGRATHFAEVDEPRARFLTHYRTTLTSAGPGSMEIRQVYSAGAYHVIVEGITTGEPPDTTLPVCLIYTIEDQHITRLYAY